MPRFLIESHHEAERMACARAIQLFLKTGSHFVANAEWGCGDGDHRAWIIVDVPSREDAMLIVPPAYRSRAKVIALNRFTLREIEEMLRTHGG
jgi:hypothetical protein